MKILDGKKLNAEISNVLRENIATLKTKPHLVILQVGNNSASNVYVGMKVKFAEKIGAKCSVLRFPQDVPQDMLLEKVRDLNGDYGVHGVILQLPIPDHLDSRETINLIKPEKDVDGLGAVNVSKLFVNDDKGLVPATARGVITLLKENGIEIASKKVVVIGRSLLVGKSTALSFINEDATVTVCHSKTKDLKEQIKTADIVVVATGVPGIVTDDMLNEEQVVVDVGISVVDGKVVGDVKLEGEGVGYISPVPGGVGPMTVASLFQNLLKAYNIQHEE